MQFPRLLAALNSLGFDYVFSPPLRVCSHKLIDSGLLIASRYPIVRYEFIEYRAGKYVDRFLGSALGKWERVSSIQPSSPAKHFDM